jgi:hypothetical protein
VLRTLPKDRQDAFYQVLQKSVQKPFAADFAFVMVFLATFANHTSLKAFHSALITKA